MPFIKPYAYAKKHKLNLSVLMGKIYRGVIPKEYLKRKMVTVEKILISEDYKIKKVN